MKSISISYSPVSKMGLSDWLVHNIQTAWTNRNINKSLILKFFALADLMSEAEYFGAGITGTQLHSIER